MPPYWRLISYLFIVCIDLNFLFLSSLINFILDFHNSILRTFDFELKKKSKNDK